MIPIDSLHQLQLQSWCVIDHVLSQEELLALNHKALKLLDDFTPAKIGAKGQFMREESWRKDSILWIDPFNVPVELNPVRKLLDEIQTTLNQQFYLGLNYLEMHWAYYAQGAFYKRHSDVHQKDSNRILTWILYLNPDWKPSDGGELLMYLKSETKKIEPLGARLVLFLSKEIEHEVLVTHQPRLSLTGWFHQKEIHGLPVV
jgi:SM-20-related protein